MKPINIKYSILIKPQTIINIDRSKYIGLCGKNGLAIHHHFICPFIIDSAWVYYWFCLDVLLVPHGFIIGSAWVYYWFCMGVLLVLLGCIIGSAWVYYWFCMGV